MNAKQHLNKITIKSNNDLYSKAVEYTNNSTKYLLQMRGNEVYIESHTKWMAKIKLESKAKIMPTKP